MHEARALAFKMSHTIWEFYVVNIHDTDVLEASSIGMVNKALPGLSIARGRILIHQFKILDMFRFR